MHEPTLNYVQCPDAQGGHRMAYWQWGVPDNPHVVVCVHGLSRQGRDFDALAIALCARLGVRVVAVDVVGRGQSDWLQDPMGYQVPMYAQDMAVLLPLLNATTLDWVGTSMGGLIGMVLCGQPGSPVRRLVLNDVGPVIQPGFVARLGDYLGADPRFTTLQEGADYLWSISSSFGLHTPEQWLEFSRPMLVPEAGGFKLHYDPAIVRPIQAAPPEAAAQGEALLWQLYDNIQASTLLLRGAQSDLLSPTTALAMTARGPRARLLEFEDVGHAPTLLTAAQIDPVVQFLGL